MSPFLGRPSGSNRNFLILTEELGL